MRMLPLCALLLFVGCRPYACWFPPALSPSEALVLSGNAGFPAAEVRIVVDDIGVPHISGESDADLSYGLGFMHARDRLFEVMLVRAVATGRLAEVLGDFALPMDQSSRFFLYNLDAQIEALSEADRALVDAYRAGLDAGAAHAGPSFEMTLLGLDWEPLSVRDVLAISRMQAQGLSTGLYDELARARILNRVPEGDPRREALLSCHEARGVSVLEGAGAWQPGALHWPWQNELKAKPRIEVPDAIRRLVEATRFQRGGSNAWAFAAETTSSGHAVLTHDPHLAHQLPSLFYLAHLEGADVTAAGATIPGMPFVGIGHGAHVAWGIPLSYIDTIDVVRIEVDPQDPSLYVVDGELLPFETFEQSFQVGAGDGATTVRETWRSTVFGPVLPASGFGEYIDEGETYAVLWSPFLEPEAGGEQLSAFWRLARATSFEEARVAIEGLRVPPMSFTLAFTDGSIGYFPSAAIPLRLSDAPTSVPRDGSRSDAGWAGFLSSEDKPQVLRPPSGFLVAANQAVVPETDPRTAWLGCDAAPPYRALRIHERLAALVEKGEPSRLALLEVQQDIESVQARELAPIYARACPDHVEGIDDAHVRGFCEALAGFDGTFDLETRGAIPLRGLILFVAAAVVGAHVDDWGVGDQTKFVSQQAVERAIRQWGAGQQPLLLDDPRRDGYEGLGHFMALALPPMLQLFDEIGFGRDAAHWRYGDFHVRYLNSPLGDALPVIGNWLFGAGAYEETGCGECIRAESGFPVTWGAVLRMSAEMRSPPDVRFVLAGGQSGRLGHPHLDDQYVAWQSGTPFRVALDEDELSGHVEGRVRITPP